jgi:hypothetical protein
LPQRLNSFFKTSQELSQLSGKVRQLRALQQLYEQVTPSSLLRSSHVVQIEHNILTLAASNSAIAAKLRQLAPELIKQLVLHGCEVTGIHVKVQVTLHANAPPQPVTLISPHGKQELNNLAGTLPDSPLKRALQRLIGSKSKE